MPKMRDELEGKARAAKDKQSAIGEDIDLNQYLQKAEEHTVLEDLSQISPEDAERMLQSGLNISEEERAGSFIQVDHSVVYDEAIFDGVEIMSITDALEKYDWLSEYIWKAVDVGTDKYTAQTHLNPHGGYFIRALPGAKVIFPVQSCLYLSQENLEQNVHNIIIAEPDSDINIITGCSTSKHIQGGLHVGVSEFYVKERAKLSFIMIHSWAEDFVTRPRSAAIIEEGGMFLSNYISLRPVRSAQMYPTARLVGRRALARFNSILYAHPGSKLDVGSRIVLEAPETRGEIISRGITTGGTIIARGHLRGDAPEVKAHMECNGLILSEKGIIRAVPELEGRVADVDMSHEAAVGKIAAEEIEYLMARGLSEEEATSTIVRGFLNVEMSGLPSILQGEVDKALEASKMQTM